MRLRILITEDREKVARALSAFYANRPGIYGFAVNHPKWDKYADLIARYTKPGGRVLELGSGNWRVPYTIYKRGFDVDGCDVWSESYLAEQVRQMPANGPRLVRYDGSDLPYPAGIFDTVCSLTVFEHLLDASGMLREIDRVLCAGGMNIILTPNCAGPHAPIHAIYDLLVKKDRRWRYETIPDAIVGLIRSFTWPLKELFSANPSFFYIYPRMKDGKIDFIRTDDDVVHLSCPSSYKKWFKKKGYRLLIYNRGEGKSPFARFFNRLFPSYASEVCIVAQKPF